MCMCLVYSGLEKIWVLMVCSLFKGDAFLLCKYCNCILCFISYISISFFVCRYSFFVNLSYFCGQLRQFNLFTVLYTISFKKLFLSKIISLKDYVSQRLFFSEIISLEDYYSQRLFLWEIILSKTTFKEYFSQVISLKKISCRSLRFFLD